MQICKPKFQEDRRGPSGFGTGDRGLVGCTAAAGPGKRGVGLGRAGFGALAATAGGAGTGRDPCPLQGVPRLNCACDLQSVMNLCLSRN
jgi:hypothetical protein